MRGGGGRRDLVLFGPVRVGFVDSTESELLKVRFVESRSACGSLARLSLL